ncbi:MAG: hypothetical protein V4702_02700 [Patescibacteria group bacterium]
MNKRHVDHKDLIKDLETVLAETDHKTETVKNGKIFKIKSKFPKTVLTITITDKWVGYEFDIIDVQPHAKYLGSWLDTDNYPLNFDADVTLKIYDEVKQFLTDFINMNILFGLINGLPIIAKPIDDERYEVEKCYNTKWLKRVKTKRTELSIHDIQSISQLKPIKL